MEKYKINRNLGVVQLPFNLTSNFDDSLKEQKKDEMVEAVLANETSEINDYEMAAFGPSIVV